MIFIIFWDLIEIPKKAVTPYITLEKPLRSNLSYVTVLNLFSKAIIMLLIPAILIEDLIIMNTKERIKYNY